MECVGDNVEVSEQVDLVGGSKEVEHVDIKSVNTSVERVGDDINLLESVQERPVKMLSGLQGKNYTDRLKEVGLTSLEERRKRGDMIQVWKTLDGKDDKVSSLKRSQHSSPTANLPPPPELLAKTTWSSAGM